MDQERLKRRVKGRHEAQAILSLIDVSHPDTIDGLLDELTSALKPKETAEQAKQRERQFAEYANYRLTFGEHAGCKLEDIPREYLEWLADSSTATLEMVTGYLETTEPDDE